MPLALPLLGMTFGSPLRLLALLFGMLRRLRLDRRGLGRRASRGPLAAGSLLWTRLLSRSVGLRLDPLGLRSASALRLGTLDGRSFVPGSRRRLRRLLTWGASGRQLRGLLTLRALARRRTLGMVDALGFCGRLHATG